MINKKEGFKWFNSEDYKYNPFQAFWDQEFNHKETNYKLQNLQSFDEAWKHQQGKIDLIEKQKAELIECLSWFTDQKSEIFPKGEMLEMHGGNGDGNYYCVFNRETIVKAREAMKVLK